MLAILNVPYFEVTLNKKCLLNEVKWTWKHMPSGKRLTWLVVPELSLRMRASPWDTATDSADCWEEDRAAEAGGVETECGSEGRLSVSTSASSSSSSSSPISSSAPRWQSTRSTRSSFSMQVSVLMFRSMRYCRRSLTRSRINLGRRKAVPHNRWQVVQRRRFSCSTEHREQKLFLQSEQTCCEERERDDESLNSQLICVH